VLVVVVDEPASVTDAYAVIKVLSSEYGLRHFKIVTNMTRSTRAGSQLFATLLKVTHRFLDVVLEHAGDIPDDDQMRRAIREQRALVEAFPGSPAGLALRRLARTAAEWLPPTGSRGHIEFFTERLVAPPTRRLQVIK
jgi:flagellar biosynthesis protein FlhG